MARQLGHVSSHIRYANYMYRTHSVIHTIIIGGHTVSKVAGAISILNKVSLAGGSVWKSIQYFYMKLVVSKYSPSTEAI